MRAMRAAIILSIHPPVTSVTYTRLTKISTSFSGCLFFPSPEGPGKGKKRDNGTRLQKFEVGQELSY